MSKTIAIVLGVILLILIAGGVMYYKNEDTSTVVTPSPSTPGAVTPSPSGTTVQAGVPLAVTNSSVSPTDTTAIVNGSVNPKGALTSYWYEYGTSASLGSKTNNQTLGSGFVSISAPGYITGLVKNTTYYYKLVAENQYGRVSGTQYAFQTTSGNPPPVGSAPTTKTLSATGISRTTANLNGEVTPNKATTQYWFEYGKTNSLGNTSAFAGAGDGSSKLSPSVSLSNLDAGTTYYFRINAQNQFGTINGSILNFKTSNPASPSQPTVDTQSATIISASGATLQGTVNPNGAETKYWFEYSTDSLLGSVLLKTTEQASVGTGVDPVGASAVISSLNSNTTYYFRLIGQNSKGTVRGDKMTFKTK